MSISKEPEKHYLKRELTTNKIPIYKLKYLLGEDYPSRSQLWLMLNGYREMPKYVVKGIKRVLS